MVARAPIDSDAHPIHEHDAAARLDVDGTK